MSEQVGIFIAFFIVGIVLGAASMWTIMSAGRRKGKTSKEIQVSWQFINKLLSLAQAQDRNLQVFKLLFENNGWKIDENLQQRYESCLHKLRKIQETVARYNRGEGDLD